MAEAVKQLHVGAAVIGGGGWRQMTADAWQRVTDEVRKQFSFLANWANEIFNNIAQGIQDTVSGLINRANMYGDAAFATFSRFLVGSLGVNPDVLPAHPGDGSTICRARCRCGWRIEILNERLGNWNAYWMLEFLAEHCETCLAREEAWQPFRVRFGIPLPGQSGGGVFA